MQARHLSLLHMQFIWLALGMLTSFASATEGRQSFTVDDYFSLKRITELALSSDGEMLAYAVEFGSLEENRTIRTVYISATRPGADPILVENLQDAQWLVWIPGRYELAYLSDHDGAAQLFSYDVKTKRVQQYTNGNIPVVQFSFAPDGAALAWLTQAEADDKPSPLYERLSHGEQGVVLDPENTIVYQFINPEWPDLAARPQNKLWVKPNDTKEFHADIPGQVHTFYWSSDASRLSITYVADDVPKEPLFDKYTSLGVFDLKRKSFETIARAREPSETGNAVYYAGGEWVPRAHKILVRRMMERDAWKEDSKWTVMDFDANEALESEAAQWRDIDIYGRDAEPAFVVADESTIYSNKTVRARKGLYRIELSAIERPDILREVEDSVSLVQFDADFEIAAFVNESLIHPPEISIWRKGRGVEQVTRLNADIDGKHLPDVTELSWKGKDTATVRGWLFKPTGQYTNARPWPLLTFVHGGPTLAFSDEFAFYFKAYGGLWPYPFEAYALNGIAVFIPNYRGTGSFGDKFANPTSLDGEPVDDIIFGVEHLIAEGIADPYRLAISGHSHGAWLGSLAMTRARMFEAGSFAEGSQNTIVNYSLMPGFLNRITHDVQRGASLYDDPQRYIEDSSDLHFKGLYTAVLFEAGAKSLAINMMGSPKAAERAGMPAVFVVYPKTDHNIRIPRFQRESAIRNLDWFRFWLKGEEDADASKADQYARWRAMREKQCARVKGDDTPWYCMPGALDETTTKH